MSLPVVGPFPDACREHVDAAEECSNEEDPHEIPVLLPEEGLAYAFPAVEPDDAEQCKMEHKLQRIGVRDRDADPVFSPAERCDLHDVYTSSQHSCVFQYEAFGCAVAFH